LVLTELLDLMKTIFLFTNISETRPLIGDNERNAVLVHKISILRAEHSSGFGYVQENTKLVAGAAFGLVST